MSLPITPDPAANCGMPDRPLSPPSSSAPSASSAVSIRHSPPRARGGAGGEALPLADRCWELFCAGKSYTAIGRTLNIDRETAAHHIKAMHQEVQAEHRADRALATQQRIQATAWDLLARAQAQLQPSSPLPAAEGPGVRSSGPGVRSASGSPPRARGGVGGEASLADCARLLNIILASARETARLELLYDKDAPARRADQGPSEPVHIIIERVGDPYVAPTQPSPAPPQPLTGCDPTSSAPPNEEGLGELSASPIIPPAQPAPATAVTPPAGTPTPPAPAPPSDVAIEDEGAAEARSASEPTPTWIPLGDGSMVRGTPAPPSRARSGPSELGKGPEMRRLPLYLEEEIG